MKVRFDTTAFQLSHGWGKNPRGTGMWGFGPSANCSLDQVFWHNGSFADAKKAAAAHFSAKGVRNVTVMP